MQRKLLVGLCVFVCRATWAQYGGMGGFGGMSGMPSGAQGGLDSGRGIGIRPWAVVNGFYSHQLDEISSNIKRDSLNGFASAGVSVGKVWQRSSLTGGFVGSGIYRSQGIGARSDRWGYSNVGNLAFSHLATPRLRLGVAALGGVSDGGYGVGSYFSSYGIAGSSGNLGSTITGLAGSDLAFGDTSQNGLVDNEIVYNRVRFLAGTGNVQYSLTQRVYLKAQGMGSVIRRSQGLSGTNLQIGGGGMGYRLNERNELQLNYSFGHLDYTGLFGGVTTQTAYFTYMTQLGPNTSLGIYGGGFQLKSKFNGQVQLSDELAALLGISTQLEVKNVLFRSLAYGAMLSQRFASGNLTLRGDRGVAPGNGVMLASVRERVSMTYGRSLTPRVGSSLLANYTRTTSRVGVQGRSTNIQAGAGLSYRLWRSLHLTGQGGFRYLDALWLSRQREAYASAGLGWTPGELPLIF